MKHYIIIVAMILLFTACKQAGGKQSENESATGAPENASIADTVEMQMNALSDGKPSNRKFIRSAELKFRVNDVNSAAETIEGIVQKASGFVIYTHLSNQINQSDITVLSRDSSLETIRYTIKNNITLRVPSTGFDTVLKEIALLVDFLDYKIVQSDDVSFQVLSNNMTIRRAASGTKKQRRESADLMGYQQEEADRAKVENLSLTDRMKYSDIRLEFTQRPLLKRTVFANEKNTRKYEPGFGRKLIDAIADGWLLVESLFLMVIKLWSLILLGIAGWLLYHKYKK
ncbi:MAG TPA: DUF4349 domain-containing protein [Sediminibacterium sp.]|nr:DUF4349 domain-containing protein [Sediminibacterium sp.]